MFVGVDFGTAFEIPDEFDGKAFFAAVVLKVRQLHLNISFVSKKLQSRMF